MSSQGWNMSSQERIMSSQGWYMSSHAGNMSHQAVNLLSQAWSTAPQAGIIVKLSQEPMDDILKLSCLDLCCLMNEGFCMAT